MTCLEPIADRTPYIPRPPSPLPLASTGLSFCFKAFKAGFVLLRGAGSSACSNGCYSLPLFSGEPPSSLEVGFISQVSTLAAWEDSPTLLLKHQASVSFHVSATGDRGLEPSILSITRTQKRLGFLHPETSPLPRKSVALALANAASNNSRRRSPINLNQM